ncbi:efflux transporter periplasmic adaptor subunit [Candidimonas nitroreducens]|uniref:Efflux transporter periplasmic adaptor subunit n=2 Tax=Candidimonas nitroreducens TaxID=683354 RepID=A0A225MZA2_9BURK|nr:efflux transporter periplasmic adaptor subunit [Candidimonas nitroreducens]
MHFLLMSSLSVPMSIKPLRPCIGRIRAYLVVAAFAFGARTAAADAPPTVTVLATAPRYGVISQPLQAYGTIGTAQATVAVNLPYPARLLHVYVQNGQSVARGAPLFVVQADPAALLASKQAATAYRLAKDDLAHTRALYAQSLATRSQLETARKAALDAQSALDAQRALGIGNGTVTIAAPADGVITRLGAIQGDQVPAGAAILLLALHASEPKAMPNVMLGVDPATARWIRAGDPVTVSGLSPEEDGISARGRIVLVGAAVDPQSQLVDVGASVSLAGAGLLPGMHVKGRISTRAGKHWIVPRSAVLRDGQGAYIYQLGKDLHAHRVDVKVRIENGNTYGIDGALDAARPLVVTGNYELHDGDAVHVQARGQAGKRPGMAQ